MAKINQLVANAAVEFTDSMTVGTSGIVNGYIRNPASGTFNAIVQQRISTDDWRPVVPSPQSTAGMITSIPALAPGSQVRVRVSGSFTDLQVTLITDRA